MKNILFFFLLITGISSCTIPQKESKEKILELRIESELASGVRNDTIFLGFRFGMSKNEVNNHLKILERQKKIYVNSSRTYEYEFVFGENTTPDKGIATFSPEYFKNRLYKFSLSVKSEEYQSGLAQLVHLQLLSLFAHKYGYTYLERESIIHEKRDDYVWVDGNRMIQVVSGLDDARVFYTDLIAKKAMTTQKSKVAEEEKKKTIKDI